MGAIRAGILTTMAAGRCRRAPGGSEPARGAPIGDVLWGTGVATAVTALVIWVAMAHRAGRITWLGRVAGFSERVSGLPGWAALPAGITGGSLMIAVFGFYWDVAKHIDTGRDPGPFGTAAHYPILIGLFGIALGGFVAIVLGTGKGVPTSIRLAEGWNVPLGGVLIFLCGAFALTGFPLDDIWHTLFGQDVTLWGPTHVLMIGGASLATLGVWVLLVEAKRASGDRPQRALGRLRVLMAAGSFLIGLSTLQGEFDYGVPQFQLVFQPILLMFAASLGLVAARVRLGRWGALQAVAFFLVLRGLLTLAIGPVIGMSTLHFPLYIAEGVLVELVAWRIPRERPLTLGVVSGALIGTVGLAAEWGWSHVWMPLPWPSALLPEAAILGLAAALAGGVLGGYVGRALTAGVVPRQAGPRWLLPLAAVVAVFCIAFPMPMNAGSAGHRVDDAARHHAGAEAHGLGRDQAVAGEHGEGRRLADRHRLAGRRADRRPPEADRSGRVPHHHADPRVRQVEVHAAPRERPRRARRADLPPGGQGDPRQGGARRRQLHAPVRARQEGASAGGRGRHGLARAARLPAAAGDRLAVAGGAGPRAEAA